MDNHKTYIDHILQRRQERETNLLSSPLNWFSLTGLFPLNSGENTVGDGPGFTINIVGLSPCAQATITIKGDDVSLTRVNDLITINGTAARHQPLRPDVDGEPDLLESGSVTIMVIRRGNRFLLRVWDREAAGLKGFHGLHYYPVDPVYRVVAAYLPFDPPKQIIIHNAIGSETERTFPGMARFLFRGVTCSLVAEDDGDELLFSFTDLTSLESTYPGGRLLLSEKPVDGQLVLDFNLARNWPCAYTPYATCPLPPAENHLGVRIEAGEKRYHNGK